MKKSINVLILFSFIGLTNQAKAQHSMLTLDEETYHLVDRFSILGDYKKQESGLCTSIKPFSRQSVILYPEMPQFIYRKKREFNRRVIENETWDVLPDSLSRSLKINRNKWKNFYQFRGSFFSVDESDFKLVVNPVLAFEAGQSNGNNIVRNTRGAELRGSLNDKVGFYSFLSENQFIYPEYYDAQIDDRKVIPGAGLIKDFGNDGHDFFNVRGYITFKANKFIDVQFGHDKNFIGNGYRSLIISDFAKENLALKFHTKVWRFDYVNIFSEMSDFRSTGLNGLRKKYSAIHYLNFQIIPGKLEVGAFENVIFARNDANQQPGFDFNYLNPIIFYRAVEHGLNSTDNSVLGVDWKWNFANTFSFYGQALLDEFHKNELFGRTGSWVNKWGFQSGLKWLNVAGVQYLDAQVEANLVRPYVYSHFKTDQSWTHYNQSMAHPFGANFKEYIGIVRYQVTPKLNLVAKYFNITHGADSMTSGNTTHYGGNIFVDYNNRPKDLGIKIGDGVRQDIQLFDFQASYQFYHRTYVDFRYIYRDQKSELPLESFTNSIVIIGLRMNISSQRLDF